MLATKRSADVTPDVNQRNPLHRGNKAPSEGSALALKPRTDVTRSPEHVIQWPHKKQWCPPIIRKPKSIRKGHYQRYTFIVNMRNMINHTRIVPFHFWPHINSETPNEGIQISNMLQPILTNLPRFIDLLNVHFYLMFIYYQCESL